MKTMKPQTKGNNMETKRKVRKDFNPAKEYSVDVSECTEEEKKKVQQAFFDVGIKWQIHGEEYNYKDVDKYTNTTRCGEVTSYLMFGSIEGCNMTVEEFFDLVYEPEQQGHVHAELMAQYAEDAKTHDEPWKLWQVNYSDNFEEGKWTKLRDNPSWVTGVKYRRKPMTHNVHGVEIPDLRIEPKKGDEYYLVDPTEEVFSHCYTYTGDTYDELWVSRRLCYEHSKEGRQAAILHAKAMLGIS